MTSILSASSEPISPSLAVTLIGLAILMIGGAATVLRVWEPARVRGRIRVLTHQQAGRLLMIGGMMYLSMILVPAVVAGNFSEPTSDGNSTQLTSIGRAILLPVTYGFGLGVAVIAWTVFHRDPAAPELGMRPRFILPAVGYAAIGLALAFPLTMLVAQVFNLLFQAMQLNPPTTHQMLLFMRSGQPGWIIGLTIASAVLMAPVFEEICFRVFVQTGFTFQFPSRWPAILLSSLAFALLHEWWTMPAIFTLSFCIGYAYERTGNAWTAILMHVGFNAINTALFLIGSSEK